MSPRRKLPPGIRGRGSVFTHTWRDHRDRQFSRKAGDTLAEAEAFKRRIEERDCLRSRSGGEGPEAGARMLPNVVFNETFRSPSRQQLAETAAARPVPARG